MLNTFSIIFITYTTFYFYVFFFFPCRISASFSMFSGSPLTRAATNLLQLGQMENFRYITCGNKKSWRGARVYSWLHLVHTYTDTIERSFINIAITRKRIIAHITYIHHIGLNPLALYYHTKRDSLNILMDIVLK